MLQNQFEALESVRTIAEARVLAQWVVGEDAHWLFMHHDKATGIVSLVRSGMDGVTQFTVQYFLLSFELAPEDTTMTAELYSTSGTWRSVADSANVTISKDAGTKEPSSRWKKRMLLCEHSPIRLLSFVITWHALPYYVSVHFCRHKIGIEHWVSTQRSDRTGVPREKAPQDAPVTHSVSVNAQALMTISRKRLCNKAAPETRKAWQLLLDSLQRKEPEIVSCCVRECVYRNGFCPEFQSCGYNKTQECAVAIQAYQRIPEAL